MRSSFLSGSPLHLYNHEDDVERLVSALTEL